MLIPAETLLVLAHERQRELIADADRYQALRAARRARRRAPCGNRGGGTEAFAEPFTKLILHRKAL